MLKKQYPAIDGLQNTLLQGKKLVNTSDQQQLQVIHSQGNHWIIASTVHDEGSEKVLIYDSLYNDVNAGTQLTIQRLFGPAVVPEIVQVHKQQGLKDCGLFAIAFSTAICFKQDLSIPFNQGLMRQHLIQCFEKCVCLPFPLVSNS